MNNRRPEGISDLTTTEGNLKNFTRICALIKEHGGMQGIRENRLVELIRDDQSIRRRNVNVIGRHLSILRHLNVILKEQGAYILDLFGKMLNVLTRHQDLSPLHLSKPEKVFYFVLLLTGKTLPQLAILLYTIGRNEDLPKNQVIYRYYKNILESKVTLWNKVSLRRRLRKYEEEGILRRPEPNRFDCMRYWLEDLDLVSKYRLTKAGTSFVETMPLRNLKSIMWSDYPESMSGKVFYLCTFILNSGEFDEFSYNYEEHRRLHHDYFEEAYRLFGNKTLTTLNSVYVHKWIPMKLLSENGLYCTERYMDAIIQNLYNKKLIKAVIPADYHRRSLLKVAEDKL